MSRNLLLSWIFGMCLALPIRAQVDELTIRKDYHDSYFVPFVQEIEAQYSVRFFYVPAWVDSLQINQPANPTTLGQILDSSLNQVDLYWHADDAGNIILAPYELENNLPVYTETARVLPRRLAATRPTQSSVNTNKAPPATAKKETLKIGVAGGSEVGTATLSGTIRDVQNTEVLIGASVVVEAMKAGVSTDHYGYYSLTLPTGLHELTFRSYGMEEQKVTVQLNGSGKLDRNMTYAIRELDEVMIEAERDQNIAGTQMGLSRLDIGTLKALPAFMGEIDVIKAALMLPGVQSVGEGASGFNVRGGSADQNLILINQAPVFNPSHVFGFFSVFNPDLVKSFDLYKSGIPAQFGGRISSVLDIAMKDGNKNKLAGSGGISPVTGRLTVEGPLLGNQNSFIIGARSTYSDWILKRLPGPDLRNSSGGFYDVNAKVNFQLSENDRLDIAAYHSRDRFRFNGDTSYVYRNLNGSVSWKHLFNDQLYGVFSGVISQYNFEIESDEPLSELAAFQLDYAIDYKEAKADFTYIPDVRHQIKLGTNQILYSLRPGEIRPVGQTSEIVREELETEKAWEGSVYFSEEYDVNNRLKIYAGLRYSYYLMYGAQTVYQYADGQPKEESFIVDSTVYNPGEAIRFYHGPEWRFLARYGLSEKSAVKGSLTRMRQYLHMLSNTTSISPTDTWKLSDTHIRPQVADQVSLGYYHNFRQNSIEASAEIYYKWLHDIIEFKNGADLLLNPYIETDIINAKGRAYGVELLVRKERGKLNGWISYTWSRTEVQVNGEFPEERVNEGRFFPANFDLPHNFSFVGNLKLNRRLSFSSNFIYTTGRPITYPVGQYQFGGGTRLYYSFRNQFRIPDYYRWDLSVNIEGNHKIKKLAHSSWSCSIFNVLGRRNPYSVYFVGNSRGIQGYKLSVFGQAITTVTYNFKF